MSVAVIVFSLVIFSVLEKMQARNEARNRELAALDAMGRHLISTLSLDQSLAIAVDGVAEMTGADAVAIVLSDEQGRPAARQVRGKRELVESMISGSPSDETIPIGASLLEGSERGVRLALPLQAGGQLRGMLLVASGDELTMTQQEAERFLRAAASLVVTAIERNRLVEGLRHREREAQALYRIGLEISSLQDLSKILQIVVGQARDLLGTEAAAVCMMRELDGRPRLAEWAGPPGAFLLERESSRSPAAGLARRLEHPHGGCAVLAETFRSGCLAAPLIVGPRVVGELCVADRGPREFTDEERVLLAGLADMAAIAISNANLLERERGVAVLEERDRLAREMHDSLAQILGFIHLKAKASASALERGDGSQAREEFQEIADLAHEAYADVREAILGLRDSVSPSRGLVGTLAEYIAKFSRQSGIAARFEPAEQDVRLSPNAEVQLVRVIQEGLTNVRKHSGATSVLVRMEPMGQRVRFTIEDNGRGFDVERLRQGDGRHFGIQSMRERVERVGGSFAMESTPGVKTRVTIVLPLAEEGGEHGTHHALAS